MKVNFEIRGSGSDLVFLHGWQMNQKMMSPLISILSKNYRCISLDLFGFGESEEIENYQTFKDYVSKLHEFLMSVDVYNPIFIAHSFGARIAICYANTYPTKALILTGAAGIKKRLSFTKKIKQTFHHLGFHTKGSYDYEKASPFLKKVLVEVVNTDLSEQIRKIQLPVLLIWGELDQETPYWMAKKMKNLFQNSILICFKEEDHFAYYHQSQRFCFIVKEYLEEVFK